MPDRPEHTNRAERVNRSENLNRADRRARIVERDGPLCVWCGTDVTANLVDATTEHVVPKIKGGPSWIENEVLACKRCNGQRGHVSPAQWADECDGRGWLVNRLAVQRSLARLDRAIARVGGQRRAKAYLAAQLRRMGHPQRGGPQQIPIATPGDGLLPTPWAHIPEVGRHHDLATIVGVVERRGAGAESPVLVAVPKASAVLIALYEDRGDVFVVLTRRSWQLRNHAGEVSFPGGRNDPGETPEQTALREAYEEIGLDPGTVTIVGELDHRWTLSSASYIVPKVAVLPGRPSNLVGNPGEVDGILHVSLDELTSDGVHRSERWVRPQISVDINFFELFGDTIWGATAGMLRQLLCLSLGVDDAPGLVELPA